MESSEDALLERALESALDSIAHGKVNPEPTQEEIDERLLEEALAGKPIR